MKSAAWVAVGNYANILISFVIFVVLARLLSPMEFGIVAVATVFLDVLLLVARGGLPDAIVQRHDLTEEYADTAFWVSAGSGIVCCLILFGLSYPISLGFGMPELSPILKTLSIVFVLGGLTGIHEGRLQRSFGFRSLSIRGLIANLASGAIALWFAFNGYGVWSLVIQRIATSLASMVITWLSLRWVPRFHFDTKYAVEQLKFGSMVFGTTLLLTLNNRIHELIAALFLSTTDVGYLRMGWRCIDLASQFSVIPLASVALPTYSRLQHDRPKLENAYLHFIRISSTLTYPALLGMGAIAPVLLPAVFGPQWQGAAPTLQVLCLLAAPFVTNSFLWPLLVALNKTNYGLAFTIFQFVVGCAMSFVAAPFGVLYIAVSHVVRAFAVWPIALWITDKQCGISTRRTLLAVGMPLASAVLMALAILVLQRFLPADLPKVANLVISITCGSLLYFVFTALLAPDILKQTRTEIVTLIQRRRQSS
ncbi:lipopolysaccharide biosynthesis protein [Bradyrhizobium sp. 1]|uniref:lipopolysaccharide biosynthesis protein n=1 Tax=Bradyrhizobium sp. 1 TaxID=241591 RepID=UPI001FF73B8A|nr:lipopolysaccharide biosynthesis protein [Bradyrhizobium sp. 1]